MQQENVYLRTIIKRFGFYKELGEKAILQLDDQAIHRRLNQEDNSIAVLVRHMHGNMLSRFTDFLTSDGEKSWRKRDEEFIDDESTVPQLLQRWEEGWQCVIAAMEQLQDRDLNRKVMIRSEEHLVLDAILRQVAHYAYHVGQIVFMAKTIRGPEWQSLSIPKNQSAQFNAAMRRRSK